MRVSASIALATVLLPSLAAAEGFLDLYAGASFTERDDVEVEAAGLSLSGRADYKDTGTGGIKGGY